MFFFSDSERNVWMVELKTPTGVTKRAIHKICPLPLEREILDEKEQKTSAAIQEVSKGSQLVKNEKLIILVKNG